MEQQQKYNVAIIGGGVYGLSIAYHLAKTECNVALFERFTIGNVNGSSHGPSRISRSAYEHEFYRDLNTLALKQYWPEMEATLNSKLIFKNPFIVYCDEKNEHDRYAETARSSQLQNNFSFLSPKEVPERFPSMPEINSLNSAIVDNEAAMIAADDYVERLGEYLRTLPNVAIFENIEITKIWKTKNEVNISSESETILADKVIVASGRWASDLFPELKDLIHVVKQYITYVELSDSQNYQFGRIPSFLFKGLQREYYTTPDRKSWGFKIASHLMGNDSREEKIIGEEVKREHEMIAKELFGDKFKKVNKVDSCYYTVSKSEEFIIDWIDPQDEKILIVSCCSGHGFKFSPVLGKIVSDVITTNKSMDLFEKWRYTLQIPYHRGTNLH